MALNNRLQNVKAVLSLFHSLHRNLLLLNQLNLLGQEVKLGLKVCLHQGHHLALGMPEVFLCSHLSLMCRYIFLESPYIFLESPYISLESSYISLESSYISLESS